MRYERHKLASVIAMLITCGERLDIEENPHWHAVATAAMQLEQLHSGKPINIDDIAHGLRLVLPAIAAVDSKIGAKISVALAIIDGMRLGFLELPAPKDAPLFIGIDYAAGESKSAMRCCHA